METTKFPTDAGTITRVTVWTTDKKLKINYFSDPISLTFDAGGGYYYIEYNTDEWQNYTVFWDTSHKLTSIQQSENYVGYKEVKRLVQVCTNGMMGWRTIGYDVTLRHLVTVTNRLYFLLTFQSQNTGTVNNKYQTLIYFRPNYDAGSAQKDIKINGLDYISTYDSDSKYNFTESEKLQAQHFNTIPYNITFEQIAQTLPVVTFNRFLRQTVPTIPYIKDVIFSNTLEGLTLNPVSISQFTYKNLFTSKPNPAPTYLNTNTIFSIWLNGTTFKFHHKFSYTSTDYVSLAGGASIEVATNLTYSQSGDFRSIYWAFVLDNDQFFMVEKITIPANNTSFIDWNDQTLPTTLINGSTSYSTLSLLI